MPLIPAPVPVPAPEATDIRLITVDMDGTLLDDDHELPADLGPLLTALKERDVLFCPASGRQYATLARQFADVADDLVFIAENGSYVVRRGEELSSDVLDDGLVAEVLRTVRGLFSSGVDVGAVVCGKRSAYVERTDREFLDVAETYYALLEHVDDVLAVEDEVLKVAVFDFGAAHETTAPALEHFREGHQVVVSGAHWVDVMTASTHKGAAVRRLQELYGITSAQTLAFGDYLNDLEMLDAADHSYAMANAHPDVLARARFVAPSNTENGVVRTIVELLDISLPESPSQQRS